MWLVEVALEEKHSVPGPGAGKGWHAGLLQWYCVGGLDSRVRTILDCASTRGRARNVDRTSHSPTGETTCEKRLKIFEQGCFGYSEGASEDCI